MKNKGFRQLCMIFVLLAACLAWAQPRNVFTQRFLTLPVDMYDRKTYNDDLFPVITRAAAAGYNGVMMNGIFYDMDYNTRKAKGVAAIRKLVAHAKTLNMEIVPWSLGQKDVAIRDSSLVEAFPVKGTPFRVSGSEARVLADPNVKIVNGGFEEISGALPTGWRSAGILPAVDRDVKRSGEVSVRYENPTWRTTFSQTVGNLKPFRAYALSVWVRTNDYTNSQDISFLVIVGGNYLLKRRDFGFCSWDLQRTQGWREYVIDFNTTTYSQVAVKLRLAKKGSAAGTVWFDDVRIREVGLYETVRRSTMPVVVRSEDGLTTYVEGRDYVVKEGNLHCGGNPDNSGFTIPAGSAIRNGQTLKVDWGQHGNVETITAPASFCAPEARQATADLIRATDEVFDNPRGWNVYLDEWRVANWDPACTRVFKNAGDYMGAVAAMTDNALKRANGNRVMILTGDMYLPYHNARAGYAVTNGGVHGAWERLPKSTILWNWLSLDIGGNKCIRWAGGLDPKYPDVFFQQMVSAYVTPSGYNTPGIAKQVDDSLTQMEKDGLKGVVAFATVHYARDYQHVEAVADVFKASGRWGSGPLPWKEIGPGEPPMPWPGASSISESPRADVTQSMLLDMSHNGGRIAYTLGQKANVTVKVLDVLGRTVYRQHTKSQTSGKHSLALRDLGICAGLYLVRLEAKVGEGTMQSVAQRALVF